MSQQQLSLNKALKNKTKRIKRAQVASQEAYTSSLHKERLTLLAHNLNKMHSLYIRWRTSQDIYFVDKISDYTSVWLHWMHFDILAYKKEFIGKAINYQKPFKLPYRLLKDPEQFWTHFNPYDNINMCVWRLRFADKARNYLLKQTFEFKKKILDMTTVYTAGYLNVDNVTHGNQSKIVKQGPCYNMVFFTEYVEKNCFIVFCTEMNRFPMIENGVVVSFNLTHHMKVIDFCDNQYTVNARIMEYVEKIKNHADMHILSSNYECFKKYNDKKSNFRKVGSLFYPFPDSTIYLSADESKYFVFNPKLKRWVTDTTTIKPTIDMSFDHYSLIKNLGSKEAGKNFIKILASIPNFNIKLTEEQNEAVSKDGNIVLIGRSGTGKTTCSVLRMFAAELLFKYKLKKSNSKFTPDDIGKTSVLHCAFVTASPVLTNEVKRFYGRLKMHVQEELEKIAKKKEAEKQEVEIVEADEVRVCEEDSSSEDEDENMGPNSMNLLKDNDFPLFYTIRRLIFMIDGSLKRPFFARDLNGNVIGAGSHFEWHNECKGSLKISSGYKSKIKKDVQLSDSESSEEEEDMQSSLDTERMIKRLEKDRKLKSTQRNLEVDFKVFKDKFWPTIKFKTRFSALVVWTEITAYIKGSALSHMYIGNYLPKINYANRGHKNSLLTREEKMEIWDLFMLYEKWRMKYQHYDFQDIVNYILGEIMYSGYSGVPIHYMMVDEVQDLTPATISLLIAVSKEKLLFSGDTAQTIAKGVGFRFCDLEELFKDAEVAKPTINYLTMNFRTHNQILGVANSIVSLLETLFPQTIDKMAKETSPVDGPMPLIISSSNTEDLFYLLFGAKLSTGHSEAQFGCNQVIIVRNQESKDKLHPLLSHALCLTVFEAKGLEFDDVILFNFFTDSDVSIEKWKILSNLMKIDIDTYYKKQSNYDEIKKSVDKLKCLTAIDQSKLALLCTELKNLYVAVTRPKKNLVIFDEDPEKRRYMEDFWDYMQVIHFFEKKENEDIDYQSIARKTNADAWRNQGERMMSHKFYDQAAKCFLVSGDEILEKKARAFAKATKASTMITVAENSLESLKKNSKSKSVKNHLKVKINEAETLFVEAAEELLEVNETEKSKKLVKHIAQCFASGKKYLKAAALYKEIGFIGQAAECYSSGGDYLQAAEIFEHKGDYARAVDCFSLCQNWDRLIRCLHKYKDLIPPDERRKYVYKYMPVALEAILPKILPNEQTVFIKKIVEEQKDLIVEVEESEEESDD